jgi:hypothetical protein
VIGDAGWHRGAAVAVVDVAAEVDAGLGWVDRCPAVLHPVGRLSKATKERPPLPTCRAWADCPTSEADGAEAERKRTAYDSAHAAIRSVLPMSSPSLERHSAHCGVARDAGSAE